MVHSTTTITAVLGVRALTAIITRFTRFIMRASARARDSTRIHARILCGLPLKDHRGGMLYFSTNALAPGRRCPAHVHRTTGPRATCRCILPRHRTHENRHMMPRTVNNKSDGYHLLCTYWYMSRMSFPLPTIALQPSYLLSYMPMLITALVMLYNALGCIITSISPLPIQLSPIHCHHHGPRSSVVSTMITPYTQFSAIQSITTVIHIPSFSRGTVNHHSRITSLTAPVFFNLSCIDILVSFVVMLM